MSAILGAFGSPAPVTDEHVRGMLGRMSARGIERTEIWRDGDAVLAVGRFEWEMDPSFSGNVLIAEDGDLVIAADASVYYRNELRAALVAADVQPVADTAAHLLLAAWRAWGEAGLKRIDGDFAFILWDRGLRRAVAAREFGGKRPLHYAELGQELVVASTIGGVAAHPRCRDDLNLPVIAATMIGTHFSAGPETAIAAVNVLGNAQTMSWKDGRLSRPVRYWEAPVNAEPTRTSEEDAAVHLRELLATAVQERLQPGMPNTVWMSGGWDSTAVFGGAQYVRRRSGINDPILPVSITYPEGDPGREDHWIQAIADQWNVPVNWISIDDIPFFADEDARARARDEPHAHLYESWNTALATGTRASGARIALDGNGGDQLFQNSDAFLADLFRSGRWLTLAREWKSRPRGGFRPFFRTVLQPNMTPALHSIATAMRGGRRLKHYLERPLPPWIDPEFAARHDLENRDRGRALRPIRTTHAMRELDWYFTSLFVARGFSLVAGFALAEGVEVRSPLSDRRIIDFALSRPWWERSSGAETKKLLRRSMHGLLPSDVLAPRAHRTGVTGGYSHRSMVNIFPALLEKTMEHPLMVEELGMVRSAVLRSACDAYKRHGDPGVRVALYYTLETELWLRAHYGEDGSRMMRAAGAAEQPFALVEG